MFDIQGFISIQFYKAGFFFKEERLTHSLRDVPTVGRGWTLSGQPAGPRRSVSEASQPWFSSLLLRSKKKPPIRVAPFNVVGMDSLGLRLVSALRAHRLRDALLATLVARLRPVREERWPPGEATPKGRDAGGASQPGLSSLLLLKQKKAPDGAFMFYGGGGIRTLGTGLAHTRFPSVLLRPLGHSSENTQIVYSKECLSRKH